MIDHDRFRHLVHWAWWGCCSAVALGAVVLGRPVIIFGQDRNPELLAIAIGCSFLLIPAILAGGRWVTAFVVCTGFDLCLRIGALIVDESPTPLPPKSRALAALLFSGYAIFLAISHGTYQTLEGESET